MNRKCQVSKMASRHGVQPMETRYSYFEVLRILFRVWVGALCKEKMLFTSLLYSLLQATQA